MTKPLMDPTIDHETWWKERNLRDLEGHDFTEYGDPQYRTGECFYCGQMYGCDC